MKIYLHNPENGEFTREEEAVESPLEKGVFLIPAFATTIAPPAVKEGEVAGFSGDAWTVRKLQSDPPRTPAMARAEKLAQIKGAAFSLLSAEDYKVQRHGEQTALCIATTLSEEEYISLLEKRQSIRDRSNGYEANLAGISDIVDLIDALQITY